MQRSSLDGCFDPQVEQKLSEVLTAVVLQLKQSSIWSI